jgi:hypothetical protein
MSVGDLIPWVGGKAGYSGHRTLRWIVGGAPAAVLLIFVAEQFSISAVNGWWTDELFSLWASDPQIGFGTALASRIAPDSNLPLYPALLYWVRTLVPDDRTAIFALNIVALLGACATVIYLSARADQRLAGFMGASLFVLSGPTLRYIPEGRVYFVAIAISFVASWYAAVLLVQTRWRPSLILPALIGIGAAFTHLFAALACGALAAGILGAAVLRRDRALGKHALALGIAASITSAIWIALANGSASNLQWIEFTPFQVKAALWEVKQLAFGSRAAAVAFVAVVVLGLLYRPTRLLTAVFIVALTLFFVLPVLVSFRFPIITGRYWTIGTPLLLTLVTFLLAAWNPVAKGLPSLTIPAVGITFATAFAVLSCIGGFMAARSSTAMKPIWKGAEVAAPLLGACPAGSVAVLGAPKLYAIMSKRPKSIFFDAESAQLYSPTNESSGCRVLGWAEHVRRGDDYLDRASDTELLQLLSIDARSGTYEVKRHGSGFVVLRSSSNAAKPMN